MPEKKKILVADDDESICNLIKLVLEQNDFAVTTVNDGKSACDLVSADDGFDLIILDIVMPLMFGTDAAKEIRRLTDTPIMFLTARSTDDDKVGAYASGADDYLVKPFSTVELQLRVNALLKRARKKTQRVTFLKAKKQFKSAKNGLSSQTGNIACLSFCMTIRVSLLISKRFLKAFGATNIWCQATILLWYLF